MPVAHPAAPHGAPQNAPTPSASPPPGSVGIFSEDGFVGEALVAALSRTAGLSLICTVTRLRTLKRALLRRAPAVLVLDSDLAPRAEPIHPLALVANARAAAPETALLVLLTAPSLARVNGLLRAGASGVVVKDKEALPEILRALPAVADGSVFLCSRAKTLVLNAKVPPHLARGEMELVQQLARRARDPAFTRKDIAQALFIAEGTLSARIAQLKAKLDVESEEAIVALCRDSGLVE